MEPCATASEASPRPRLLVADDSPAMRQLIGQIAVGAGWQIVAEVPDGRAAVEAYCRLRPDAVTLDLTMPPGDGLDALRSLRTADPAAQVVIVTGLEPLPRREAARRLGARAIVQKPFPAEQLAAALGAIAPAGLASPIDLPGTTST